tara:strand:- start:550 stop:870 length:321 start_codon:yes stop_codon:yes gene_type:complete
MINLFLKNFISLLFLLIFSGCVKDVKTEILQKSEFSYLKFKGNYESIFVVVNDGEYEFNLDSLEENEVLYKIEQGKHRIQIYRNNNLISDRLIFLENQVTTEILIP